ncbi:YvcK family protein [Ureibacillus sp. FSL K6-8385]|uniref:Gluconeogenesis factor n=1 Tax=Ureibacillus terrenus TaxID=118246 RepID=A0A540V1X4_9BACL|nr:YvcK family protein [Ureibacillus terrenus]MED3661015.1 YvcK family protein [Ureibacillus terrenus]MED3763301.1 YvcK family protein [Ureibacillus terrenus]TQE90718.1 YvcK family protein [Ureibacillus terrenus]
MGNTNIVVIGGGTGLSTILRGLKLYPFHITAIVTVTDDGGSSGRLRDDYDIPPPGDIRNVIAALSDTEPLLEQMFQYRFSNSQDLGGHSLGNLMLTALTDITGDFFSAIIEMSRVLNVNGKVIPSANGIVNLHAELLDGQIVKGESKISLSNKRIKRVFLVPEDVKPLPEAIAAINSADMILIGPGSLYTSIIPNLLVKEIQETIIRSKAKKIYICNLMTQKGETNQYQAADHVKAIYEHVGKPFLDAILVNSNDLPYSIKETYKEQKAEPVKVNIEELQKLGLAIIKKDIATIKNGVVRHDGKAIAEWLIDYSSKHIK